MLNETWKEQYDRMQRSFALLKQIGERNAQPQDMIPPRDIVYNFCSDAFHLRVWIAATLGAMGEHHAAVPTANVEAQRRVGNTGRPVASNSGANAIGEFGQPGG
jgi:hypothetical protein